MSTVELVVVLVMVIGHQGDKYNLGGNSGCGGAVCCDSTVVITVMIVMLMDVNDMDVIVVLEVSIGVIKVVVIIIAYE